MRIGLSRTGWISSPFGSVSITVRRRIHLRSLSFFSFDHGILEMLMGSVVALCCASVATSLAETMKVTCEVNGFQL